MATSRTGTARWKNTVRVVRHRDRGLTNCPCAGPCKHHAGRRCDVFLDWDNGKRPNSAEVDHIVPKASGGGDGPDNARIICRRCNQALGAKRPPRKPGRKVIVASPDW